jgi:hypothetical protein
MERDHITARAMIEDNVGFHALTVAESLWGSIGAYWGQGRIFPRMHKPVAIQSLKSNLTM